MAGHSRPGAASAGFGGSQPATARGRRQRLGHGWSGRPRLSGRVTAGHGKGTFAPTAGLWGVTAVTGQARAARQVMRRLGRLRGPQVFDLLVKRGPVTAARPSGPAWAGHARGLS